MLTWLSILRPQMARRSIQRTNRRFAVETLESRHLMAADPLPVLMVLADQRDFYYQEYGDTRLALEAAGLEVDVAATTTNPSFPHAGTGEGSDSGRVTPDLTLAQVHAADYSAIVFVGGWGASMYQYAWPGDYANDYYDGDTQTKAIVNDLIGDFVVQDKYVAAICHGVTVLAWARVDGISPLSGRTVSVPWIGSPAGMYQGQWYGYFELMAYPQVVENGATANQVSGAYGDPTTVEDDVVVDGRIITAENYDSATMFGATIAAHVIADTQLDDPLPPENQAPEVVAAEYILPENRPTGTLVGDPVLAQDPGAGQSLTFAIAGGNTNGAFAIDAASGQIRVANAAALDFETTPVFSLIVEATDSGSPALSSTAAVTIYLENLAEPTGPVSLLGNDLVVQGTPDTDWIYIWTDHSGRLFAWLSGQQFGPYTLPTGGRAVVQAGEGDDRVYATDSHLPVRIFGDGGHDQITGSYSDDFVDGGSGVDRVWGGPGNDVILGGIGNDHLDGREGDDLVSGGDGDDTIAGFTGYDVLLGGRGYDRMDGGDGEDLLVGGRTDYEAAELALVAILGEWRSATDLATRMNNLTSGIAGGLRLRWGETVHDDHTPDCLNGAGGTDWLFLLASDCQYYVTQSEHVTSH